MFSSENTYEEDLNLFYYKNHICYIKDLNSYLYSNNKSKKRKYFCNRCLNSFLTQENLDKHKYLCIRYNKRLEKIILPEEGSKLEFEKINHMIKIPFTIYFDIETYFQYLKRSHKKITNHQKLLKPYLVSYILKCNYNENFSKKCQIFTGFNCVSKMLYNLLTTDNDYINDVIEKYFNKQLKIIQIYQNLIEIYVIYVIKKYLKKQLEIIAIFQEKC